MGNKGKRSESRGRFGTAEPGTCSTREDDRRGPGCRTLLAGMGLLHPDTDTTNYHGAA